MSSLQPEGTLGNTGDIHLDDDFYSTSGIDNMDTIQVEKIDVDFPQGNAETATKSSRKSARSNVSSSDAFGFKRSATPRRPLSGRKDLSQTKSPIYRPTLWSSIPLPVKSSGPINVASQLKNVKSNSSRTASVSASRISTVANKHTLEIQFINKNKRYVQMKKELLEKQKPVLDLYQSLAKIKKRLEELGKQVVLEEFKLVPTEDHGKAQGHGAGEEVSVEMVTTMKNSIEEIPITLMEICRNLLSRRALIVELLESVTKSEVDVADVSDKIESLKSEGHQLQQSLDAVITEHQAKITDLVGNWQKLLSEKQSPDTGTKIVELEAKLKEQERLVQESNYIIQDLQKKMDEKKSSYDKSLAELNGITQTLKEQIKKMEADLESERKASMDFKTRSNAHSQNLKNMRAKIAELEGEKKNVDNSNAELQKKIRLLQEQFKNKESQWTKDKEEMSKSLKHQENLLQKLTAEKTQFETRLESITDHTSTVEDELRKTIESLTDELKETKESLTTVTMERDEALEKCADFESYVSRMGLEFKENMDKVSYSIEWGKNLAEAKSAEAENYIHDIAKDLRIRELEDKVRHLEKERAISFEEKKQLQHRSHEPSETEKELYKQQECIGKYQMLLEESENKLKEKSMEVANLRSEIRQLKVRQEALEEQNYNCPTEELQRMVEEGRHKLNELMKKSMESEQKLEDYASVIEKQSQQMSDMENLLRFRENMTVVLKATRDELLMERQSLTKYSEEIRTVLIEVTKEGKFKDRLIKELQEKISLREQQIGKLETEVQSLEENLMLTNEKRFKLQETIGTMEKELQSTKAHVNQLADINTRGKRNNW
ncbi:myosin heavy chain, clone 203-like isoform X2 [Cylas formicarius]|uniref:myosin heavy chain, clone 203-like isoform X2 n=1 Tax=Cylas formicarius TaxID=197179 RepID=UPI00295866D9|nr:myosin heavy chain, clone 203-like isoform X2 [Cylas formicarius]